MKTIRKLLSKPQKGEDKRLKMQPLTSERTPGAHDHQAHRESSDGEQPQEHGVSDVTPLSQSAHTKLLQSTGRCDIIRCSPAEGGATQISASSAGHTRDTCSLPPSPHLGGAVGLTCSLPPSPHLGGAVGLTCSLPPSPHLGGAVGLTCSLPPSPHLGGAVGLTCSLPPSPHLRMRRWRSSTSSPSSSLSPSLSRLWVEEALQRSKNLPQNEPRPRRPFFIHVRQEGGDRGGRGEAEGEGWSDEGEEEQRAKSPVGIRLSDTVIFRPWTTTKASGGEVGEEEEGHRGEEEEGHRGEEEEGHRGEEESRPLCLDSVEGRYCLRTPCVCLRCPSAPPFEAEVFPDLQVFCSLGCQTGEDGLTCWSRPTGGIRELSLRPGGSSALYPSLSQWSITPGHQDDSENPATTQH